MTPFILGLTVGGVAGLIAGAIMGALAIGLAVSSGSIRNSDVPDPQGKRDKLRQ